MQIAEKIKNNLVAEVVWWQGLHVDELVGHLKGLREKHETAMTLKWPYRADTKGAAVTLAINTCKHPQILVYAHLAHQRDSTCALIVILHISMSPD